jgi:hypothetical protein
VTYTARWLRFLLWHAEEWLNRPSVPGYLHDEFEHLKPGRQCSCGSRSQADDAPAGHSGVFESKLPTSTTRLDVMRAYDALPLVSRERTVVWLLLQGISEQEQWDAGPHGFLVWHRRRIQRETGTQKSPAGAIGLLRGESVWDAMARYLGGAG